MKAPLKWLREYVELPAKTADLAKLLTHSGTKAEGIQQKNGTDVLSLEITTNRPDCLSLLGIAAEIGAVTHRRVTAPKVTVPKALTKNLQPLHIEIQDNKACPRYLGRVFDKVEVRPSPEWLVRYLPWMDQKPINNVVDVTNFCLYEMGQPLHAFDYDKLKGRRIVVRRAKKGEKILAIDGNEYALDERILVIADAERPVAIAGIMGGKDTEVTERTKRVVLESAEFDPILVRRASRLLKLSSESSYRFERTVDPRRVREASDRAAALFCELAGAVIASHLKETGKGKPPKGVWIRLRLPRLNETLGHKIPTAKIVKILSYLGFKVKRVSKKEIKAKTLLQRKDIRREIDLVEEIIRIYGFDRIPETIPATRHEIRADDSEKEYRLLRQLRESLVSQGLYEAVTLSLVSERVLKNARLDKLEFIRVANPLSAEQEILRPSGLPGLLGAIAHNVNRKEKDIGFFEIAKRYLGSNEENVLSIAVTGLVNASWETKQTSSVYYLKGIVENVFELLRKKAPRWTEENTGPSFDGGLALTADDARAGMLGAVHADVAREWDIRQPVFFAEIDLDKVLALPERRRVFSELGKYPPVRRDIAFVSASDKTVAEIAELMKAAGAPHLAKAVLFDQYAGSSIPAGKRSLAFSLEYHKKEGTFTDEEIRVLHTRVGDALRSKLGAELR